MNRIISILSLIAVFLFACKESTPPVVEDEIVEEVVDLVIEKEGITLSTNQHASVFDEASLALISPADGEDISADSLTFRFEVSNYELGVPTSDVLSGQCANSGKGQHIHYIMNNAPYSAHYEAEFTKEVPQGNNVLLAFLSRSYHMSIKTPNAYVLEELHSGDNIDNFDETAPHMFYSRPKGTYEGADANKVMLDFYLINTDLQDKGYTVRATINGVAFELTEWVPYFMEGLIEGENTIQLELLDEAGALVESPFNPVERTINVKYNQESI